MSKTYEIVTEKILEALDSGDVPWRKPWTVLGDGFGHRNLESRRPYRGINQLLLQLTPYVEPWWLTFNGTKRLGGHVRKGEKSTLVVFFKRIEIKDDEQEEKKRIPLLRYYRVFNVEQCEGVEAPPEPEPDGDVLFDPVARCEWAVAGYPKPAPPIKHGGDSAMYAPGPDVIGMPERKQFDSADAYYQTLYHELTHSTGHEKRLDRDDLRAGRFGDGSYSREELVAEIGATMLCARTGVEPNWENTAAYLRNWRSALSDDPRLIVTAAGRAQRSTDFILGNDDDEKEEA